MSPKTLSFIFGKSPNKILAFHGFGQDAHVFEGLKGKEVHSFDLWFHGHVEKIDREDATKEKWERAIEAYLDEKKLKKFSVIAFSIGAKPALSLVDKHPETVEKLILIAPDGIRVNFWYKLATGIGSPLFRYFIANPSPIQKTLLFLKKISFISSQTFKLANQQSKNQALLQRVYDTWMGYKSFKFDFKELAKKCNSNKIEVQFVLGEKDSIITRRHIQPFYKYLKNPSLVYLPTNHALLLKKYIQKIDS
ncbi:alpha/beta hydrolase [Flammeovirgaceae bacterium SG7u.111]|nr:alpha/beta hydrolase [Flammeovirgaceae bacterium SG7u.132]WPO35987.1 alpha/beta hydrolase [Flammeovirgaceae bacterium SG7u.111]